jgi:hypothetical protein
MVDLASIFSDENEDFRNKAKVSFNALTGIKVRGRDSKVLYERRFI